MDFQDKNQHWISMLEASRLCAYSQEYLSLLARRGKIFSKKIGRNWYTTREAIDAYLKTQSVFISLPKNIFGRLASSLTPEEPEKGEPFKHAEHSKIFEEFERLNLPILYPQKADKQNRGSSLDNLSESSIQGPPLSTRAVLVPEEENVLKKLDNLSESLGNFAERVTRKLEQPNQEILTPEQKEFFNVEINSLTHRFKIFDRYARSMMRNPVRMMVIMITAIVAIFILAGGFSFGQVDNVVQQIKKTFKDADMVQGHFPGTHANEVLVLDKAGNVSIFGHIETQGQFRSYAPNGVAPIVVDSMTLVDNLNANYLDGLASKDFTLAFVTKNGNLTHEDVFLEGNVEVGQTLIVKGAAKLLDSLQVYGNLGVFGDAVFGKNITVTNGDLILKKGTINISNISLIKNLNAEFLDGIRKQNINLDFVTSNGASTANGITIGGLEVNGQSDFRGPGFFYEGVWGSDGAFGTLGVAGDVSIGNKDKPENSNFEVYSKKFKVDQNGKLTTNDLVVSKILSDLIPSGSFDLGSSVNPWDEIVASSASFSKFFVSGDVNVAGVTSSSFRINTDNTSSDSEDSYLAFERGATTPNAILKWDSTNKQFNFNQPVKISSSSFELVGIASVSGDLVITGSGSFSGQIKTNRAPVTAHTGTWPSFSGTSNSTLYINPSSSVTDGNLFTAAVNDSPKFVVDAEGDVFAAGNLTLVGTTTQATTNITGDLLVEGNTRLGDASSDNIKLVGTILPYTLNSIPLVVKASSSQTVDLFRIKDSSDNILFTLDQGTGLLVASSGFNFALGGSTATVSYSRLGTATTTHSNYISNFNDLLISGDLEVDATAQFDSFLKVGTDALFVNPTTGAVGVGTTSVGSKFNIGGAGSGLAFRGTAGGGDEGILYLDSGSTTRFALLFPGSDVVAVTNRAANGVVQIRANTSTAGSGGEITTAVFEDNEINFLTSGGNVGIGTSTPTLKLDLESSATLDGIDINNTATDGDPVLRFQLSGTSTFSLGVDDGDSDKFKIGTTAIGTNTRLTIDSSGNVGIGTTSPGAKLHVVYDSNTPIIMDATTPDTFLAIRNNGVVKGYFGYSSVGSTGLAFLNAAGNGAANLLITDAGSVGIGITTPSSLLTVQGRGEFQGTASASYLLTGNTLQVGGFSSVAYSRFGTNTTSYSRLSDTNDLLITDDIEVDGTAWFDGTVNFGSIASAQNFYAQVGTAASPSFSFATDQDTGMFRRAVNALGFSTLGAERLTILSNGNVGIGTTGPTNAILDANTPSGGGPAIGWSVGGVNYGVLSYNGTDPSIRAGTSKKLLLGANGTDGHMVLDTTGNVGIGTTSPGAKLDVVSDVIFREGLQVAGTATASYSRFGTTATTHSNWMSTASDLFLSDDLEGRGSISFSGTASLSNTLWVSPGGYSGNVGIGAMSPGSKLTVNSNTAALPTPTSGTVLHIGQADATLSRLLIDNFGGGGGGIFQGRAANGTAASPTALIADDVLAQLNGFGYGATGYTTSSRARIVLFAAQNWTDAAQGSYMSFYTTANGATTAGGTERMRIDNAGNVGIGTTTPLSLLHTQRSAGGGNIQITVENTNADGAGDAINFLKSSASPAANDVLGYITFRGLDSGAGTDEYGYYQVKATSITAGSETGVHEFYTKTTGTADIQRLTLGADVIIQPTSGNVGIGTTSPDQLLEISSADTKFIIRSTGSTSSASIDFQPAGGASSSNQGKFTIRAGGLSSTLGERLEFLNGNMTSLVTIASSGNVGIGTTGPSSKLDVVGDINATTFYRLGGTAFLGSSGNYHQVRSMNSSGGLQLTASDGTVRVTMSDAGNVGIGTTTPSQTLHVEGTARITTSVSVTDDRTLCTIAASGEIEFVNGACGTSSRRYKENIKDLGYGLEELKLLKPVFFNYLKDADVPSDLSLKDDRTKRRIGFIAEDMQLVIPEAVIWQDGQIESIDLAHLTALLTKGIQELAGETASLSFRIEELEAKIASSSGQTVVVHSSGSGIDVLATLANTALTKVQTLWAEGDVITEGIKKTYYSVASAFDWQFDPAMMVENWTSRTISISPTAPADTMGVFAGNAAQAAEQSKVDLQENGAYLATYGVDSTRGEIMLSGSSDLIGGEAKIFFDYSFSSIISPDTPLKVLLTPTTFIQGQIYISNKTPYGFVVKGINGALDGKFDWLVIARRRGFEETTPDYMGTMQITPSPNPTFDATVSPTPIPLVTDLPTSPTASPSDSPIRIPTPDTSTTPISSSVESLTPELTPTESPTPILDTTTPAIEINQTSTPD